MSKSFNDDYNKIIFLKKNGLFVDDILIEELSKKYIMSDESLEEKKNFLKLKKEYYKVKNIENYKYVQEKLYDNKNKTEILSFELSRILKQNADNPDVLEYIASIQSILSSYKGEITDTLYLNVASIIIFLEISLGMKIGLFRELCLIFEDKLQKISSLEKEGYKRK